MSENKTPDWKPINPANNADCEITGLPEKEKCYPKSDNPLLDYRKQKASVPCSDTQDPCELSTDNLVFPDASLKSQPLNETWDLISSDEVVVACDDIYGTWKDWDVYGVKTSITIPEGAFTEYVLNPLFDEETPEYEKYQQYVASVRQRLTAQAKARAISEVVCSLQNPETSLSCPELHDRPPYPENTATIPAGQFTQSITINADVEKTEEAYLIAANLPSLKSTLMNRVYTSIMSQLGCTYGNTAQTAYCKYYTLQHFSNKTWVLYLTPNYTVIDFDILKSIEVHVDIHGSLSSNNEDEVWNKVAYVLKYIPNNFDFETQTYNWSEAPNDVIPVYELFRKNQLGALDHKLVQVETQSLVKDWGLPDDPEQLEAYIEEHSQEIAQNFNTAKGNTADYADPVTVNGFPFISENYPHTSIVDLGNLPLDPEQLDNELDATIFLTTAGLGAAKRSDDIARESAEISLLCKYTNNEMILKCPPEKTLTTGGDTIVIPAFVAYGDNLYEVNYRALQLYISQLSLCTTGNIPVIAFCDKAALMDYVDENKYTLGVYDIKSEEELNTNYKSESGNYLYPLTEAEKSTQILLIYRHDFCRVSSDTPVGGSCFVHSDPVIAIKEFGVTAENCRAVEYASISTSEVYRNQFQSSTRTVQENNSDAIKLALANLSCMYGNLATHAYTCDDSRGKEYRITISKECQTYSGSFPGCSTSADGLSTCVVQTPATPVEKDFYLSDNPCEASEMAARITLATRVCLDCDKVGTPGSGDNINISTNGSPCSNCSNVCCWAL